MRERHAYRSLSLELRVLLGVHARFREDNMIVPPDCEAAQALLDRQYMSGVLQAGQLSIGLTMSGARFVAKNREALRRETHKITLDIVDKFAEILGESTSSAVGKAAPVNKG